MHKLCFSCVYAYRNCLQNDRFSLLYAIDAKYPFDITFPNSFRNIERPKNYQHKDFIYSFIFLFCLFVCFFFFFLVVVGWGTARKDYFSHFEPSHR